MSGNAPLPFTRAAIPEDKDDNTFRSLHQLDLTVMGTNLGRACFEKQLAYVRCRARTEHPTDCTLEGVEVQKCANKVYEDMSQIPEYHEYRDCLWHKSYFHAYCKEEKKKFYDALQKTKYASNSN